MIKFLAKLFFNILGLRYCVKIKGIEILEDKSKMLFLPNHQATVDPQIITSLLLQKKVISPMVGEKYYKMLVLKPIFNLLNAVPISDFETGSRDINVLSNIIAASQSALEKGHSILIYPSGQLCGQGYERIFNKQAAFELVGQLPDDVKIIGIRLSGLWGSMWSKAWTGKTPSFIPTFLKAIWYIIANFIFFVPKRKLTIEFQDLTSELKNESVDNRKDFNEKLEEFYNKNGEENVLFLKHYFYAKKLNRKLPKSIHGSDKNPINSNHSNE